MMRYGNDCDHDDDRADDNGKIDHDDVKRAMMTTVMRIRVRSMRRMKGSDEESGDEMKGGMVAMRLRIEMP